MGTRLYPNTKDIAVLEELCGVPAGTNARLQILESAPLPEKFNTGDPGYDRWNYINDDVECGALDGFMTYGWGTVRMFPEGADRTTGSTNDPDHVRMMADAQGIGHLADRLIETGGVHWC